MEVHFLAEADARMAAQLNGCNWPAPAFYEQQVVKAFCSRWNAVDSFVRRKMLGRNRLPDRQPRKQQRRIYRIGVALTPRSGIQAYLMSEHGTTAIRHRWVKRRIRISIRTFDYHHAPLPRDIPDTNRTKNRRALVKSVTFSCAILRGFPT